MMSSTQLNVIPIQSEVATSKQPESKSSSIGETTSAIATATITESQSIIASLVLAFSNDPANRWLYPNPYQYLTYFPRFVEAFGGKAFEHNTVYCSSNYVGVALWIPPGVEPEIELIIDVVKQSVCASEFGRSLDYFDTDG
jgi:hypothetical protein